MLTHLAAITSTPLAVSALTVLFGILWAVVWKIRPNVGATLGILLNIEMLVIFLAWRHVDNFAVALTVNVLLVILHHFAVHTKAKIITKE